MIRLSLILLSTTSLIQLSDAQTAVPDPKALDASSSYIELGDGGIVTELQARVMDDFIESYASSDLPPGALAVLRGVYARTLFEPLWTPESAKSLIDTKKQLFDFGLVPDEVSVVDLKQLATDQSSTDPDARALADLKLSVAWLRMASAVSGGLEDEGSTVSRPNRPSRAELGIAIERAAAGEPYAALSAFEPDHPQYVALKASLATYRSLAEDGGWAAIPDGEVIELGDIDPRIPALRTRLSKEGFDAARPVDDLLEVSLEIAVSDAQSPEPEQIIAEYDQSFDEALDEALRAFQKRHGLEDDGVLGPNTLTALNESVESKIDRIADTMNRWRRHGDLGERYIWANTPSYTAEAWQDGVRELSMRTIVGLPSRETPVFSDTIEYVVANPKWYAPVSIVRRDKLPKLEADPSYAARLNYKVYDRASGAEVSPVQVDWSDPASASKYRLVQQAGDNNALGDLKIIFPNQYSVYLHGTPSQHLFDEAQRAFSSGCIRLEDPARMARWLARQDETIDVSEVTEALAEDETERIYFEQTTPVHITYMTVTVGDDGSPYFWRDIYDRDDGIEMARKVAPLYRPQSIEEMINDPV